MYSFPVTRTCKTDVCTAPGDNLRNGAIAQSGSPHAKHGGGSSLLWFGVRAAPQRFVIHLPAAADAPDPTSYPCHHSPSLQAVCGELSLDCDKALRLALTKVKC